MAHTPRPSSAFVGTLSTVVILTLAHSAFAESQCRVVGQKNAHPQTGDYLATAYYRALERTLSPSAAAETTIVPFARVKVSPEGLSIAVGTFEDGAGEVLLADDGIAWQPGSGDGRCSVVLSDNSHFSVQPSSRTPFTAYTYVGNINSWAEALLFVGQYKDREGRRYSFERKGKAVFDGKPVTYSIDEPESFGFESGNLVIDGRPYRFERAPKTLTIFGPLEDDERRGGKPMWVLEVLDVVR